MEDFATETIAARRRKSRILVSARMFPARKTEKSAEAVVLSGHCPTAPIDPVHEFPRGSGARLTGRDQTGLMARPITALQAAG